MDLTPSSIEHSDLSPVKVRWTVDQSTDLSVQEVRLLGDGFDFVTYLINGQWVFRFPLRWEVSDTFLRERKLLQQLSLSVSTPQYSYWVERPVGFPMPVGAYQLISGQSMEILVPEDHEVPDLARQIGEVLVELHSLEIESLAERSDTVHDPVAEAWVYIVQLEDLSDGEEDACLDFVRQHQRNRNDVESVTIHGDLGVEHIITNKGGVVQGIIDWSNCRRGNRFSDFVGLWGWGGDEFVMQVLEHYHARPRARDWAMIRTEGLLYCLMRGSLAVRREDWTQELWFKRLRNRLAEVAGTNALAEP